MTRGASFFEGGRLLVEAAALILFWFHLRGRNYGGETDIVLSCGGFGRCRM